MLFRSQEIAGGVNQEAISLSQMNESIAEVANIIGETRTISSNLSKETERTGEHTEDSIQDLNLTSAQVEKVYDIILGVSADMDELEENIGNIIFIAADEKHVGSLLDTVRLFTKTLIKHGVRVATIRNKKWKSVLNKVDCLSLEYENEEYCIYVRKDL